MAKYVVMATWDDVPHLEKDEKEALFGSYMPHERDARSRGVPALGSGAIYPIAESDVIIEPFDIPSHWPRVFGMDVGWNKTAVIWAAIDRESDTVYLYSEHYRGKAEPSIHADAIKARGNWMPGVIDPASGGRSQTDGTRLIEIYMDLGLNIGKADNSVEAGLQSVWQRLSSGRLKVFDSCRNWLSEFRIYRRDENGKIVKKNDHLMDATRYCMMSGLDYAMEKPSRRDSGDELAQESILSSNSITGY